MWLYFNQTFVYLEFLKLKFIAKFVFTISYLENLSYYII